MLKGKNARNFREDITFIRTLLEDMLEYKTLSEYTLRRIANIDTASVSDKAFKKAQDEIQKIRKDLGADYLEKIKKRIGDLNQEVIIAVENIAPQSAGEPNE